MSDKLIELSKSLHKAVTFALFGTPEQSVNARRFMSRFINDTNISSNKNNSNLDTDVDFLLYCAEKQIDLMPVDSIGPETMKSILELSARETICWPPCVSGAKMEKPEPLTVFNEPVSYDAD